jgi:hypothetical protein
MSAKHPKRMSSDDIYDSIEITTVVPPMNETYSRVVFSISVHKNVITNGTWVFNVQE